MRKESEETVLKAMIAALPAAGKERALQRLDSEETFDEESLVAQDGPTTKRIALELGLTTGSTKVLLEKMHTRGIVWKHRDKGMCRWWPVGYTQSLGDLEEKEKAPVEVQEIKMRQWLGYEYYVFGFLHNDDEDGTFFRSPVHSNVARYPVYRSLGIKDVHGEEVYEGCFVHLPGHGDKLFLIEFRDNRFVIEGENIPSLEQVEIAGHIHNKIRK